MIDPIYSAFRVLIYYIVYNYKCIYIIHHHHHHHHHADASENELTMLCQETLPAIKFRRSFKSQLWLRHLLKMTEDLVPLVIA